MSTATSHQPASEPTPRKSVPTKMALAAQVFLIRKNIAGPLGEFCMALEHRGRTTGNVYVTPVAYLRDGADIIAINKAGHSNWFKNTIARGDASINIKGREQHVSSREITDREEIARLFELYRTTFKAFERTFGVAANADAAVLTGARDKFRYLRLTPG